MSTREQVAFLHQQINALNEHILFLKSRHEATLPSEKLERENDSPITPN